MKRKDGKKAFSLIICLLIIIVVTFTTINEVTAASNDVTLNLAIYDTNVTLKKSNTNKITASYNSKYFDVKIDQSSEKNLWSVEVNLIKSSAKNKTVTIYLPDIQYKNMNFNLDNSAITGGVLSGEIIANLDNSMLDSTLPKSFSGSVTADADNSLIRLGSKNNYKNFDIAVTGDKDSIVEVPKYFSSDIKDCLYSYKDSTGDNKISITMKNSVTEMY